MPKKCPPGVICLENMTLVVILLILAIVLYLGYPHIRQIAASYHGQNTSNEYDTNYSQNASFMFNMPTRKMCDDPVASQYEM